MQYELMYKPQALKDLERLSPDVAGRIVRKLERLRHGLSGDVKRLVHFKPGLRLRVGDWRVLFDIEKEIIWIWRVVHRSEAYE